MKSPSGMTKRRALRTGIGIPSMVLGLASFGLFSGVAFANPSADGAQHKVRKAAPAAPVESEPVFEMTPAPPPAAPLTPGQMPPNPPNVTYVDGLLSISAENSTLADILAAVKASTGTAMDIPGSAGAERVWITLGPGPARAILASLLTGTSLDYVIQSSDDDPTQIQSVLLSPRIKGGATPDSTGQPYTASKYGRLLSHQNYTGFSDSSDAGGSSIPDGSTVDTDPSSASAPSPQPAADAQPSAADASPTATPNPSLSARLPLTVSEADAHPAAIANPDQAIPQMQNLFELRRQLQQQQNAQQKIAGTK